MERLIIQLNYFRSGLENRLIDFLKLLSFHRAKLLLRLSPRFLVILESSVFFHISIVVAVITIIVSVFSKIRTITVFSLHPVCMCIGGFLFLGEGLVSFRNKFLVDSLSPIMQKGKRTKNRALHQSMGILSVIFFSLGLLFVWGDEIEYHKGILPSSFHAVMGVITLSFIAIQITVGHRKLSDLESKSRTPKSVGVWHGDAGLLVWDCLCITVVLGSFLLFGFYTFTSYWNVITVGICWISLHLQMRRKGPDTSQLHGFASLVSAVMLPGLLVEEGQTEGADSSLVPLTNEEEFEM